MDLVLLFPHHLFKNHPAITKNCLICFLEHPLFFNDPAYPTLFHKQKIAFHRSSMKLFEHTLQKKGYKTAYLNYSELKHEHSFLRKKLTTWGISKIHTVEFDDYLLEKRIQTLCADAEIPLITYPSPGFLTPTSLFSDLFRGASHYSFSAFYQKQRKRLRILVDSRLKPVGGKWSFDVENRKKAPKDLKVPPPLPPTDSPFVTEAKTYVETHFSHHYGSTDSFCYPISHEDAQHHLKQFLKHKLAHFGDYEDAITHHERILFHSVLSPLLNSGLITPEEVVQQTLAYAQSHKIPLNSLEGFLRQIIGWREFIRGVYYRAGTLQRTSNYFRHTRKIPKSFYEGTTGIQPVDESIKLLHKYAYLHHIERLMLIGNFFLLCEIDPNDVYKWFMEFFIDSYDWVMVPNVYGMSQYADGGLMTTKPYFSSSNYLLKMSDYPKGSWTEIWDALFWRFMIKHLAFFEKQPRLKILCTLAKKKKKEKALLAKAEHFLNNL